MRLALLTMFAFASLALAPRAHAAPVLFESPSHNIGCYIATAGVRCDIRTHTWTPPPKPKSCDVDWGNGLEVGRRGFGRWVCAGDTVLGGELVLAYRKSIRRGRFECTSRRNGMRCVNLRSDHGFELARRRASWF